MEEIFKSYQYTIQFMSSIGTVGAVILSIYLSMRTHKKFKIKSITSGWVLSDSNRTKDKCLNVNIENLTEHKLEIYHIDLSFLKKGGSKSIGWGYKDEYINPYSDTTLNSPLECYYSKDDLNTYDKFYLEIDTSFGRISKKLSVKSINQLKSELTKDSLEK